MSRDDGRTDSACPDRTDSASPGTRGGRPGLALLVGLAVLAVLLLAGVSAAAGGPSPFAVQAGEPPTLDRGERINDTAVELVFADDSGVDLDSIDSSDLLVSAGEIAHVSKRQAGSDAVVEVVLAEPIDDDQLTVAVRDGSDIRDVDGNRIDTASFVGVTVDGMDGVPPALRRLSVPDRASDELEIRLVFDERVRTLHATLRGPRELQLGRGDFEHLRGGQYVLTYEPSADGVYTFELHNATDTAGNAATFARAASTEVRSVDVRAVAGIDLSASEGLNLTFDARRSDRRAVAYLWEFGDGETATGQRVTHAFDPGNYTVGLEVIDEFGNAGRDRITLNLTGNATAGFRPPEEGGPTVSVERSGSPLPTEAQVGVSGVTPGDPVVVRAGTPGEPLIAGEAFSLDELVVDSVNRSAFGLGLGLAGADATGPTAAAEAAGGEPVAGFTARPTLPDGALSGVTVRFSVATDRLRALTVLPADVTLYRETGDTWEPQPTTVRSTGDGLVAFESELDGFSRFAVVAPDDDADGTDGSGPDENGTVGNGTDPDDGTVSGPENGSSGAEAADQFRVRNVTLSETSVDPGDVVEVQAEIQNRGDEPGDYLAALEVNGTVVQTQEVLRIPPAGESIPVTFAQQVNETGTVELSVNGTAAPALTVGDSGGGGLFGFLGFLGFLPFGLLRPLLLFVVAPVAVILLVLKGIATYLGY